MLLVCCLLPPAACASSSCFVCNATFRHFLNRVARSLFAGPLGGMLFCTKRLLAGRAAVRPTGPSARAAPPPPPSLDRHRYRMSTRRLWCVAPAALFLQSAGHADLFFNGLECKYSSMLTLESSPPPPRRLPASDQSVFAIIPSPNFPFVFHMQLSGNRVSPVPRSCMFSPISLLSSSRYFFDNAPPRCRSFTPCFLRGP